MSTIETTEVAVRRYWDSHPLGLQYVTDPAIEVGTREFYAHIRPWMNPYKFPWIMERIEREAEILRGAHLLEIGCGSGSFLAYCGSLHESHRGVGVDVDRGVAAAATALLEQSGLADRFAIQNADIRTLDTVPGQR